MSRSALLGAVLSCGIAATVFWWPPVHGQSPRELRAVVGGTLIDGTGRPAQRDVTILIRDGRIERVGPRASIPVSSADAVLDATGRYVVPGFIDAHLHYRDYYPELLISHGITAAAEWGGSPLNWILAQRDGVNAGHLLGPRLFTSGDNYSEEPEDQTPERARRWLDEMIAAGVNKIDIGFASPPEVLRVLIDGAHRAGLPASGYPAFAQEAVDLGIDAIKHTYMVGILSQRDPEVLREIQRQARLPYRKRDVALPLVDADSTALARQLAARNVFWVPTLVKDFKVIHDRRDEFELESLRLLADPNLAYLPRDDMFLMTTNQFGVGIPTPGGTRFTGLVTRRFDRLDTASAAFRKYQDAYRNLQGLIRNVVASGGKVLAGTAPHSYVLPGLSLHQELQLFVDAGLTPLQALQSAGLWVAQYLRKDRELGTIEAGKLADLVVLDADPTENIANTRRIRAVVQGGRALPLGYHFTYRNPIPRNTVTTAPGAASPRPRLEALAPDTITRGAGPIDLTLTGDYFLEEAAVLFDEQPVETRFVSARELRARVPASLLERAGTHWLRVVNPPPGRIDSAPLSLIVRY